MDGNNIRNMMRILGSDPEHKVHKLLDIPNGAEMWQTPGTATAFDIAYRDIYEGCKALLGTALTNIFTALRLQGCFYFQNRKEPILCIT